MVDLIWKINTFLNKNKLTKNKNKITEKNKQIQKHYEINITKKMRKDYKIQLDRKAITVKLKNKQHQ
ncbi:hypothetical protein L9G16_24405, partial [Shewanella sp. A25]|nr:hypothetical protein [Shewanella shenzhenensis]